jgi:predicted MPP superfamily phosphohydrolase
MRMTLFIGFFMIIIGIGTLFSFFVFNLYQIFKNPFMYRLALSICIGLPIVFIISYGWSARGYHIINAWLNTAGTIWIGALLYIFLSALFLAVLYVFVKNQSTSTLQHIAVTMLCLVCTIVAYAIYNASRPVVTTMTVKSTRLAPYWQDKKIVLFSDTHLGLIRQRRFAQNVVELVNAQNPDLVLMAGDMIDGPKIPYSQFASPFKNLKATYGVYYTPGNHEWYNVEPFIFIDTMMHNTSVLIDKKIEVNSTQIIGINYAQESEEETRKRLESTGFDQNVPSIAILHDPKNNDSLRTSGVDLVVSGHTHCGQFWPFSQIVRAIYGDKTYGVRQFENSATLTTCGIGTAQAPFRIGNQPEIVVIEIKN